ncbi:hypothetical protein NKR23_g5193 [Pleurostoma richardsiae]|uniref:DUF6594 domain-containing protein n=1 Tax=Pleurostoma richardsiae TaxID=41990 RepID=A0AA38VRA9_9PEZI|nr:hypothetical protein NKR23_g5193 [Pleurostoma richardsiae]
MTPTKGDKPSPRANTLELETLQGSSSSMGDLERGSPEASNSTRTSSTQGEFYFGYDHKGINDFPRGTTRLVKEQMVYPNYNMNRTFPEPRKYCINYEQEVITNLYKAAVDWERARETNPGAAFPDVDAIMAELENPFAEKLGQHLQRHGEHVLMEKKLRELPRVSFAKYKAFFDRVKDKHMPDMTSDSYMLTADDWVAGAENTPFDDLLFNYPDAWWLRPLQAKRREGEDDEDYKSSKRAKVAFEGVLVISGSALLLLPVSILYLISMRPAVRLAVVGVFGVLFAVVSAKLYKISKDAAPVLWGLCAYLAVIVNVLFTLSNDGR